MAVKKEKGIIVENMEEKVYTTPYGKIYYWTAYYRKRKTMADISAGSDS